MTVAEFIAELQKLPPEQEIVVERASYGDIIFDEPDLATGTIDPATERYRMARRDGVAVVVIS